MSNYYEIINKASEPAINLIDVGCHTGQFLKEFQDNCNKKIFSIGIDPLDKERIAKYDHYYQVAISSKEGTAVFNHYEDESFPGMADSLAELNTKNLTSDYIERKDKIYINRSFGKKIGSEEIKTKRLESILDELNFVGKIIHFLKIDTQGTDMDCFLSLGKYIKQCLFVQIETITSAKNEHRLYKNQLNLNESKEIFKENGFSLLSDLEEKEDWFETDVVFVNNELHS